VGGQAEKAISDQFRFSLSDLANLSYIGTMTWKLAEAKNRLSEVVNLALTEDRRRSRGAAMSSS